MALHADHIRPEMSGVPGDAEQRAIRDVYLKERARSNGNGVLRLGQGRDGGAV